MKFMNGPLTILPFKGKKSRAFMTTIVHVTSFVSYTNKKVIFKGKNITVIDKYDDNEVEPRDKVKEIRGTEYNLISEFKVKYLHVQEVVTFHDPCILNNMTTPDFKHFLVFITK